MPGSPRRARRFPRGAARGSRPAAEEPPEAPIVQVPKPQLQVAEEVRPTPRPATRPEGMSALGMASARARNMTLGSLWWRMPCAIRAGFTDLPGGNIRQRLTLVPACPNDLCYPGSRL